MPSANGRINRHEDGPMTARPSDRDVAPPDAEAMPWGWSANGLTVLGLVLCSLVAVIDVLLGHRLILIGLLIAGPCCAILKGRWVRAALVAAWAAGLAVILGVPDGIWGTAAHIAFVSAVLLVGLIGTLATAVIEWSATRY